MKRLLLLACLLLPTLVLPVPARAAARDDYARQWPLTLGRDDGGAYRIVLDEAVYRQVRGYDLGDIAVLDRDGTAVPAAVFAPEQPLAQPPRRVELPWFALPAVTGVGALQGWELIREVEPDGRLRRVEARIIDRAVAALPRSALLVDLSRVREAVVALELEWQPLDALDLGYTVEASDDLEHWQPLPTRGRMVDLRREGRRLLQRRIALYGLLPHYQQARYLRLMPDRHDQVPAITRISAELAAPKVAPAPQWLEMKGRRSTGDGRTRFEFELDGRFPVQQVDVALPGNHAVQWRLESRDRADADWRARVAPWMAYRIDAGARRNRSAAQALNGTIRDRHWRLSTTGAVNGEPTLRLGYRPEVVVFLAQGQGGYTLVAGSARAEPVDSPVPQLVAVLRRQQGADWQPSPAYLGSPQTLAGDAALAPRRDWTAWLLWAVLVLGALVVGGFALSVLRKAPPPRG
ncbi:MAG: DUF3999 domain-containing protein [Lysobacter sp.]